MLRRILFCLKYYFFLLTFFVLQKPVFLLFHARNFAPEISSKDFWQVVWHGLPLDFSMSAYLSVIPFLLVCISVFKNYGMLRHLLHFYTIFIFIIATILFSVD
ncbi:MAG: LTA synthase family protein, partial [Paludibacteraceae bacterium]|nr:LTA synthase family protein [Paludibacteraceae bacterium]